MTRFLLNPLARAEAVYDAPSPDVRAFHRALPGYAVTPLHEPPLLADEVGVRRLWVKDETSRFGLPAFKMLGASWAAHQVLAARGQPTDELVAATDGNHGRAVARVARDLGLRATILVPASTVAARKRAIADEGAAVIDVQGTYGDALAAAAAHAAADPGRALVSDTSWPGHDVGPRAATEGYSTIFNEIDEQGGQPDLVMVQIGVGALAAAVVAHYAGMATIIGVEPESAACALVSAEAGALTEVPGPHPSVMTGLNCGTPSAIAWPAVSSGIAVFVAVDDQLAVEATRLLREAGIAAGETGAAGLAGLLALSRGPARLREAIGLERDSRTLVIVTEGDTTT